MDFDERLRDHMHEQGQNLTVRPEGVGAVAHRSRVRRQRRNAGAVAAALLIVAGLGGWILATMDSEPQRVATQGIESDESPTTGQSESAQAVPADTTPTSAPPEPGASLTFSALDAPDAPGGFNVYQNGATNGVYYVLSTAPGVTYDSIGEDESLLRNNTLYTFDGDRWSQTGFGDRFVSAVDSGEAGVLYTVSTGSPTSRSLEIGASSDGGTNWSWTPIDLSDQFGEDPSLWPAYSVRAVGDDRRLVVVNKVPGADYEQAVALAQGAGLDITAENTVIFDITDDGIRWIPEWDEGEQSPCRAEFSAFMDERLSDLEQATDSQGELDETLLSEFEAQHAEIETEALALVGRIDGCQAFVDCQNGVTAQNKEVADTERQIVSDMGIDPDTDYWDGLTDDEVQELSLALEELGAAQSTWLETSGCGESLYGPGFSFDESEAEFITWESLGVTPPASWSGSTHAYLVDGSDVTALGPVFGEPGYLVSAVAGENSFEVTFDNTVYESEAELIDNDLVTWASPDGIDWTSGPASSTVLAYDEGEINGWRFSVFWDETSSRIQRTNDVGSVDSYQLNDLAPDLATDGYTITGLRSGGYGVVAWAVDWEEGGGSIVVYSADGVSWGATHLDLEVVEMIVGDDGVMVFMQDPAIVGTGDPQPVLLGRAT